MKSLNTDEIKKQAVVDFASRKRAGASKASASNPDKEVMKQKITKAKEHANDELVAFRAIIEEAITKINDLALFYNVSHLLDDIFIKNILEDIVEPIIKGNKNPSMDDEAYRKIRQEMFKELIYKYEKQ